MIFITGDTHGDIDIKKLYDLFDFAETSKDDYLIILGDVGYGMVNEKWFIDTYQSFPITTLFIDGNHDNHDLLDSLNVDCWNGGNVHFIKEDIIHLMRGQVFEIDGYKFFTFGGANSIDKQYRTRGMSWWEREMPDYEEYLESNSNLEANNFKVDYVLTHTCPTHICNLLVPEKYPGEEELQEYFENISKKIKFNRWFFGHFHEDINIDNFYCVYDEIIEV